MSPIEVRPEVPIHVSESEENLTNCLPTLEKFTVNGNKDMYVLPQGNNPKNFVKVHGFKDQPGGQLFSIRFSRNTDTQATLLTTKKDKELYEYYGVEGNIVDGVSYIATDPIPDQND